MTNLEWANDPVEQKKFFDEMEFCANPVKLAAREIKKYTKDDAEYWMFYANLCTEKSRQISRKKLHKQNCRNNCIMFAKNFMALNTYEQCDLL